MGLNKSKGNMYDWVEWTWNAVKGRCPHDCAYCYVKRWGEQKELRLDDRELTVNLGENRIIFVGSGCDMWAEAVPGGWVEAVLERCRWFKTNTYLFQSKNPRRFLDFKGLLPPKAIFATTIETNRWYEEMGEAPKAAARAVHIGLMADSGYKTSVTIEPIMDFDPEDMVVLLKVIAKPKWVSIGANTTASIQLAEPPREKIVGLIEAVKEFAEVKIKSNLSRLLK